MDVDLQRLLITFVAAVITMLATGLGAVPFFFLPRLSEKWSRWGYAFASGVMLAASVFDLLMPAVQRGGYGPALAGLGLGTVVFLASEEWLGDREIEFGKLQGASARKVLLILGTLFIHSFPEGVAIGVGYGAGEQDSQLGLLLALAISIQNIPEGLAISLPLKAEGVSTWRCVWYAIFSSLPQPIAAVPAFLAVSLFQQLLPFALSFAAGAMGFLVFTELFPESLTKRNHERIGSIVAGGFLIMMALHLLV
jgi:ZIP family zinc transporter